MIQNLLTTIALFIHRIIGGVEAAPALVRVGTRRHRAATFIEYALLAAVALAVVVIFRTQLSSIFSGLMDRLRSAVS